MANRECLSCGMTVSVSLPSFNSETPSQHCPKCDSDLLSQSDGSCLTRDIAHQRESVAEALDKLEQTLNAGLAGFYQELCIIVGGGLIKEEVLRQLYFYQQEGYILSYDESKHNRGAIMIRIRA